MALLVLSAALAPEPLAARSRHHGHAVIPIETTKPQAAIATPAVPLPQPRPAEAPPRATEMAKGKDAPTKDDGKENAKQEAAAPEPQPPSACRQALTDQIAIAPSIPAIHGPGACGGDDLVRLEAVVLPDKTRVALTPAGIMRCTMATAVANWVRDDVAPEAAKLGSSIKTLDNFDSYECRGRNGVPGAHLSEHGHANAIDVHGFKLADGRMIELTDRTQPREFREAILHSACTRFPTVLGPGSDGYHEDHVHVDLIERRSNYRICQWDVLDPLPKVAPLLPEERPADAPPRAVAQAADQGKAQDTKAGNAKGTDTRSSEAGKPSPDKPVNATEDRTGEKSDSHTRPPTDKTATGREPSAPPPPPPSAATPAKMPAEVPAKPDNKPATASKPASSPPAPDQRSTAKPAEQQSTAKIEKRTSEKPASEQAASEKPASDKTASDKTSKTSRKKVVADKPRRHHHRGRIWNPFASFF